MNKVQQLFGENLKTYRKRANLTQDELSEKLGVSLLTIQNWENGRRWPSAENIERACLAVGCTAADLFAGQADANQPAGTSLGDAWQLLREFEKAPHDKRHAILVMLGLSDGPDPERLLSDASAAQVRPVKQKKDR